MQCGLLLVISVLVANGQLLEKSRSVWVEQGLVRGKIYNVDGNLIQIFRGIPYAEPPVGNLRFKKPVKKIRWHQELSAVEYGPPCLQFMDFHKNDKYAKNNMEKQSEDCLYLNVFSPYDSDDESKVYPIVVWIHGGSFLAGSADTGIDMEVLAKNIVQRGVSFVSINYRLGPLGFMNWQEGEKVVGNSGIWDMVMALQWIQANMKQFNGDPTKVTVMGESAGGAAASLLALSPVTQGIVHQAIIMSGSSMAGWAIHRHSTATWSLDNLIQYLRCKKWINEADAHDMVGDEYSQFKNTFCNFQSTKVGCLTDDLSKDQIFECLQNELNFTSPYFRKALAVELGVSKIVVDGDLVPSSGLTLAENFARVPIMTGIAQKEWAHKKVQYYNMQRKVELTRKEVDEQVFRIIDSSFHETATNKLSNSTLHLLANSSFIRYLDHPSKTFFTTRVVSSLQKLESDIEFVAPCHREINAYAEKQIPVYLYTFDYVPEGAIQETESKIYSLFGKVPVSITRTEKEEFDESKQAFHGLDHAFIFSKGYSSNFQIQNYTKRDETLSKMLCTMITNFVKTGNPSTQRVNWPMYTVNDTRHVSINIPAKIVDSDLHWPDPQYWNQEALMISKYVAKDGEVNVDPDADLTNEERVQLSAYRRSWYALWVLVCILTTLIWATVAYFAFRKSKSTRSRPYDNILLS